MTARSKIPATFEPSCAAISETSFCRPRVAMISTHAAPSRSISSDALLILPRPKTTLASDASYTKESGNSADIEHLSAKGRERGIIEEVGAAAARDSFTLGATSAARDRREREGHKERKAGGAKVYRAGLDPVLSFE